MRRLYETEEGDTEVRQERHRYRARQPFRREPGTGCPPVAFALKELTATDEVRIGALVKKAVS